MEGPRRVEVPLDSSSDSVNLIVTVSIRYQFGYLNLHARLSLSVPGIEARCAVALRSLSVKLFKAEQTKSRLPRVNTNLLYAPTHLHLGEMRPFGSKLSYGAVCGIHADSS